MIREVEIVRLSFGTVYKLIALGLTMTVVPFGALMGVFALLGATTVTMNDRALTGLSGLVAGPLLGILMVVVFTVIFGTAIALGLWVYSLFRRCTIRFEVSENVDAS